METAEDITSETFATALETWPRKGVPENPAAWLYTVAKNKTRNHLTRRRTFTQKVSPELIHFSAEHEELEVDLSDQNITDSQLQMLFAICHPSIPEEAQVGLALRILCGFGIDEIACAFLTNKETINKRLYRARKRLRSENIQMEMPAETEIENRMKTVLTTLYLLFSEGYYSESDDRVVRKDLCLEAMRLTHLLTNNPQTDTPAANALLSLMCFHSSRFEARKDDTGEMVLYQDQNESLWNDEMIARGAYFLKQASRVSTVSTYHLQAGIAYWHTRKEDTREKWRNILQLYNQLLVIEYAPIAALNRTFALSKVHGKEAAIAEAEKLKLYDNHFYFTLLGELYTGIDNQTAKKQFQKALSLARTQTDKHTIQKKIDKL